MRKQLLLALIVASASACAGRTSGTTLNVSSQPLSYSCDSERVVRRDAGKVYAGGESHTLGWQDGDGDHFVSWPITATAMEATEYVMPDDPRSNAVERVYDTSKGHSRADWRVKRVNVCTANRGYTKALELFADGTSLDELARNFDVDRFEARKIVHSALMKALTDYHRQTR